MIIGRRHFIAGLIGLVAAPAVVRANSLMPIASVPVLNGADDYEQFNVIFRTSLPDWPISHRPSTAMCTSWRMKRKLNQSIPYKTHDPSLYEVLCLPLPSQYIGV